MSKIYKINDDIKITCQKIVADKVCSVSMAIFYQKNLYDRITFGKAEIKSDKFTNLLSKTLDQYEFDFTDEEIEKIRSYIAGEMTAPIVYVDRQTPFNEAIRMIREEAETKEVMLTATMCIYNGYLYIAAANPKVQNVLDVCGCEGWKPLAFKQELKINGLLETGKNRSFDKTEYTLGDTEQTEPHTVPYRFLKIRLKQLETFLNEIEKDGEDAE